MFNNISWQGYWLALALTVAFYYLAILLFYYKGKVLQVLFQLKYGARSLATATGTPPVQISGNAPSGVQQPVPTEDLSDFENPAADSLEYMVYACMDELTAYFEEAKAVRCNKEDILHAIKRIADKYPAIGASEYKSSLSGIISTQCESICSIHLSEGDVHGVWLKG